jgi:hypothetical protein
MDQQNFCYSRKQALDRYVQALDAGNFEEIASVLLLAESDAELDRRIAEVNNAYAEELGLAPSAQDAEMVRDLLRQYLPSAVEQTETDAPIKVSEVAARLVAENLLTKPDRETGRKLLHIQVSLPDLLNLQEIRKLGERLRIQASDRFWRAFREAALQMSMGRSQTQMAAARRKRPLVHRPENPSEGNHAD